MQATERKEANDHTRSDIQAIRLFLLFLISSARRSSKCKCSCERCAIRVEVGALYNIFHIIIWWQKKKYMRMHSFRIGNYIRRISGQIKRPKLAFMYLCLVLCRALHTHITSYAHTNARLTV